MTITVAMRCLSGPDVGMGHLMRCREIARHLKERGHSAIIMGPGPTLKVPGDDTLFIDWQQEEPNFEPDTDCSSFLAFCARHNARYANMDDYRISPAYQKSLRMAGLRTLQQFDASKPWPFWADFIVNAGPAERIEDYTDYLCHPETRTLFGPAYAVLRPEFINTAPRPDGRPLRRLFVCFGGGNDKGVLAKVIGWLRADLGGAITLVVVCAATNPAAQYYKNILQDLADVEFHIDPPDVAQLMRSCDAALLAGGTMSYEAAISGLPLVLLAFAPNQERACSGWQKRIEAVFLGQADRVQPAALVRAVGSLMTNDAERQRMAAKGRQAIDGRGVIRLVDALLNIPTQKD